MKFVRYWITFEVGASVLPLGVGDGCGVTAYGRDDALLIVNAKVFGGNGLPEIVEMIENVDLSTLDEGHVIPNIGDVTVRSIWFPRGF